MTPVFSGGLVYEYSEEPSGYGLVNLSSNGSAQLLQDYVNLQSQYLTLNISALQGLLAHNTSVVPPTCDPSLITTPDFNSNFTIPEVPPGAQTLIDNGISPKPIGSFVEITDYKVTQQVENVNGTIISGLAIIPLPEDDSNNPGDKASVTSSSPATSTGSGASSTKKSAAFSFRSDRNAVAAMAILCVGSIILL
jgi:hypothetical protein